MADFDIFGLFDFLEGDGDAYKYTSTEFTTFLAGLCGTGVSSNAGSELVATNVGLAVTVGVGNVYIKGRWGTLGASKVINLSPTAAGYKRYDRIVARMHLANRKITLETLSGAATTGTPVKPTLTQTNDVYELPLWAALVNNGSTVTLEDERVKTYNAAEIIGQINGILSALTGKSDISHGHALTAAALTGVLPVAKGGTGASDAAGARTALGAAADAHTHALTDAGVTGMLPVTKGGTGAANAADAIAALGYAANMVIFSETAPAVVDGKIWLKPITT